MDISTLVQDERDEFVAFLASLAPEQWDMPSLCTEWTVKQLALHYLSLGETGPGGLVRALVASGFSLDGAVNRLVAAREQRSTGELVQQLRTLPTRSGLYRLFKPAGLLLETFTHHQDARRPLGAAARDVPPERLTLVAETAVTSDGATGAKKRARGLRFEATDIDWSHGDGPVVQGPAEAIVLTVTGRAAALEDLSGQGTQMLASRL